MLIHEPVTSGDPGRYNIAFDSAFRFSHRNPMAEMAAIVRMWFQNVHVLR